MEQVTRQTRPRSVRRYALLLLAAGIALTTACSSTPEPKKAQIVVPSTATSRSQYRGDGSIPEESYVIRMSDGRRDWEVSFPSTANGYQVRIPLEGGSPGVGEPDSREAGLNWEGDQLSAADKELLEDMRRQDPDMEREGVFMGGENAVDRQADRDRARGDGDGDGDDNQDGAAEQASNKQKSRSESAPAPTRPSYLKGIAEVQELYEHGKYELAMVRLGRLDEAYPNDVKILSMKGSLWLKLGRKELARKAWEQALQLDPDNEMIAGALERLDR